LLTKPAEKSCKDVCYVESICIRCEFYNGTDDGLECAAFKVLKELVEKRAISLTDIKNADIKK
jgi:hypothetical protein